MNQFNTFIESLRRLYQSEKISEEKISALYKEGKITKEEELYILAH